MSSNMPDSRFHVSYEIWNLESGIWNLFYSSTHLTHNAEPDVESGHCGIEKASLGGALRHHADSETAPANDLRLAFASERLDAFSTRRPCGVKTLALLVIIGIVPV